MVSSFPRNPLEASLGGSPVCGGPLTVYLTNRTFEGIIIVTMVTKIRDNTVTLEAHLTSLGRNRDRWCLLIPPKVSGYLGKQTRYRVKFTPIGTIHPVEVRGITL